MNCKLKVLQAWFLGMALLGGSNAFASDCDQLIAQISALQNQATELQQAINSGEIPYRNLPAARAKVQSLRNQAAVMSRQRARLCATPPPQPQRTVLHASGSSLLDTSGNVVMLRGVNVPPFHEGDTNDIDAVANAIATQTQANVVRLQWWTKNPASPEQKPTASYPCMDANALEVAIATFASKGIISIVSLHDLTGKAIQQQFHNIITAFWTRPDIVAIVNRHQSHVIIDLANEWGPNWNTNQNVDSPADISQFMDSYSTAIKAVRATGLTVPLMVEADHYADNEKIFTDRSYPAAANANMSNGQYLLQNVDAEHNLLFAVHTYYWANPVFDQSRVDRLIASNLPFVIGEMGNIDPSGSPALDVATLLTYANRKNIGYLAWDWYNDGTPQTVAPYRMNITVNGSKNTGDGVTVPLSRAQNPWGWDVLNGPGYGINVTGTKRISITAPPIPALNAACLITKP